jgi:polyisoprenoid-binding protein YceI
MHAPIRVAAGLGLAALLLSSAALLAGEPARYAAGPVSTESSRVYARVGKVGFGHEHAVEGRLSEGLVRLGAEHNAGRLVFDMASFAADTDHARRAIGLDGTTDESTRKQVDANMRGAAVLDVARFPTATLQIDSARPTGEKSPRELPLYELHGQFTLHGKSRPVQILAEAEERRGWVRLRGAFAILQSQFGIKPFSKAFGAIGVADRIDIWGDIWVAQQPAAAGSRHGQQR